MAFFSIIIPVFNRADRITTTIQSVLNQQFTDFELIIVDDGSTDGTREIMSKITDERIRYISRENGERGAARNTGASMASGKYLNFFDSDDVMYEVHLQNAFDFVQQHDQPPFFNTGYVITSENGSQTGIETDFRYVLSERLIITNFLGCDSVFVRRDVFAENKFNEDRKLASSEDWELWLRMISRYPLISSDKVTLAMINHDGRSLFTISPDRIIERDTWLMRYLLLDKPFVSKFKKDLPLFTADRYTFFALHLSLTPGRKREALHYLGKALRSTTAVLARKRFWASLRHALR